MTASTKPQLREEYLKQRLAVPRPEAEAAAAAIAAHFKNEPRFRASDIIGGYRPIRSEIDILPLLSSLHVQGKAIALPVTERPARELHFRLWHPEITMVRNRGIDEPPQTSPELVPDLLLVPLLCFDAEGHRIGYGGGYFDRTLAHLRRDHHAFLAVGVAYAFQQTSLLITSEAFDARLDAVITERGIEWF